MRERCPTHQRRKGGREHVRSDTRPVQGDVRALVRRGGARRTGFGQDGNSDTPPAFGRALRAGVSDRAALAVLHRRDALASRGREPHTERDEGRSSAPHAGRQPRASAALAIWRMRLKQSSPGNALSSRPSRSGAGGVSLPGRRQPRQRDAGPHPGPAFLVSVRGRRSAPWGLADVVRGDRDFGFQA